MGSLRKLVWERALSIQSCFPESYSEPNSGASTENFNNMGVTSVRNCIPHQVVSVQIPCNANGPSNMNQNELEFSPEAAASIQIPMATFIQGDSGPKSENDVGNLRKLEWERTLSIQSCFPERRSEPNSGTSTEDLNNSGLMSARNCIPHQAVSVQVPQANVQSKMDQNEWEFSPNAAESILIPMATLMHGDNDSGPKSVKNLSFYVPLYKAALKGDWEKAKEFISQHPGSITARITKGRERILHIAAGAKHVKFVEELIKLMDPKDLEVQNKYGNTALCFAAASGITKLAELMVKRNNFLPMIRGSKGITPLHMATLLGYRDMSWYLYGMTADDSLTKEDYVSLLIATISSDLYDIALDIIQKKPELAIERDPDGETALHVLARKPTAFSCKKRLGMWQRFIYPWVRVHPISKPGHTSSISLHQIKGVQEVAEMKLMQLKALQLLKHVWEQVLLLDDSEIGNLIRSPSRPLFMTAEYGNYEFIVELLQSYPDLIWKVDEESRSFFHIAVIHRQEKIFKLIYQIGALKDLITSYKSTQNSNMLHLAAKLAPSNRLNIVSGTALQMQRELLWFKEVEKNIPPLYKEMRDSEGRTPRMLFTQEHESLLKAGERWMKDTASSCMLVATLITTVMFAAIFTLPGGNNNNTGIPIFLERKSFIIFTVSDALALFSSVTSILMFLSILTSRYAEEDFLETLPKRLIIGLTMLFFSIASMLLAFSASFSIVLGHQRAWIVIPVALAACIPTTLFALSQFPLVADMIHSTYGSGIFSRRSVQCFIEMN